MAFPYPLVFLVLFAPLGLLGQNLLSNPGFDSYKKIPNLFNDNERFSSLHIALDTSWRANCTNARYVLPLTFEAFYVHKIHKSAPMNKELALDVKPRNGSEGMVMLHLDTKSHEHEVGQDYNIGTGIHTTLPTALEVGVEYYVEFYAALSIYSEKAISHLGAMLSDAFMVQEPPCLFDTIDFAKYPRVYAQHPVGADKPGEWVRISGTFVADRPYQYLAVGLFFKEEEFQRLDSQSKVPERYKTPQGYYYIDDVLLRKARPSDRESQPELALEEAPREKPSRLVSESVASVYFDTDKTDIDFSRYAETLRTWADSLSRNPGWTVELRGMADARGASSHNMALSQKRAEAVADYLASRGVARRRMVLTALGEGYSSDGSQRRVDVIVTKRREVE